MIRIIGNMDGATRAAKSNDERQGQCLLVFYEQRVLFL